MTENEYRAKIIESIKKCNSKSEILSIIEEADDKLTNSKYSNQGKARFFDALFKEISGTISRQGKRLVLAEQSSKDLSEIIQMAQAIIQQHQTKSRS